MILTGFKYMEQNKNLIRLLLGLVLTGVLDCKSREEEAAGQVHNGVEVTQFVLGMGKTNCYVARAAESEECVIIDVGYPAQSMIRFLQKESLRPVKILITHGHSDHTGGINSLRAEWGEIPLGIGMEDAVMLALEAAAAPYETLSKDEMIEAGGIRLAVLATPGHTPGGVSYYCRQAGGVFTGDALFSGSVGRTDLAGGDAILLIKGIRENLLSLPDDTVVYPGHGPTTTIGREKIHNPFLYSRRGRIAIGNPFRIEAAAGRIHRPNNFKFLLTKGL